MASITLKLKLGEEVRRMPVTLEKLSTFSFLEDLVRQVFIQRLANTTEFTLKYQDNENDWVTISSDPELQEWLSHMSKNNVLVLRVILQQPRASTRRDTGCPLGLEKVPVWPCGNFRMFNRRHSDCFKVHHFGCADKPEVACSHGNCEENKQPAQTTRKFKHWGIICDGCGAKNIEGSRFFCLDCHPSTPSGLDFCETCAKNEVVMGKAHPLSHSLLEIRDNNHDFMIPRGFGGRRPCFWRRAESCCSNRAATSTWKSCSSNQNCNSNQDVQLESPTFPPMKSEPEAPAFDHSKLIPLRPAPLANQPQQQDFTQLIPLRVPSQQQQAQPQQQDFTQLIPLRVPSQQQAQPQQQDFAQLIPLRVPSQQQQAQPQQQDFTKLIPLRAVSSNSNSTSTKQTNVQEKPEKKEVEEVQEAKKPEVARKPISEFETKVNSLVEMGFDKLDSISALVKTKGDIVEAIKFLLL